MVDMSIRVVMAVAMRVMLSSILVEIMTNCFLFTKCFCCQNVFAENLHERCHGLQWHVEVSVDKPSTWNLVCGMSIDTSMVL